MSRPAAFGTVVIGGGVAGLSAAWQLARAGGRDVALVERFRLGHARGSSHGTSRITRSTYGDPVYVRLARCAHEQEWPRLSREAGRPLIRHADVVTFGPGDGAFEEYAAVVAAAGADVERLSSDEARRRFPAFRFPDAAGALHDRTGGVVDAAGTIAALIRACSIEGVHLLDETRVTSIERDRDPIVLATGRGTLLAARVIVAAGAWIAAFVPELAGRLTVRRQSIGYFALDAPPADTQPDRFPAWVYLGPGTNGIRYGLPEFGRPGVKAGLHEVAGAADDPERTPPPDEAVLARVRAFLDEQLAVRVRERLAAETCLYTSTPDEDFVLDRLPGDPRITVGSACSGHGFKFGPLTGRILAELSRDGRTGVAPFEENRARFAIAKR